VAATTVDEVIGQLDHIVAEARQAGDRTGFFAALYRQVTANVREAIAAGVFDDGPRMERLDVIFANRYLDALGRFRSGRHPSRCWQLSFRAATARQPLILQHLLLGMNAHINLDLGIAAAQTAPGPQLPELHSDFDKINGILSGMVRQTRADIDEVSPWIDLLDHVDPQAEDGLIRFSLDSARASAWSVASRLSYLTPAQWPDEIDVLDSWTTVLGNLVLHPPGWVYRAAIATIRARESSDVPRVIDVLGQSQ
jgi:Family of unknown function (DUF5995)